MATSRDVNKKMDEILGLVPTRRVKISRPTADPEELSDVEKLFINYSNHDYTGWSKAVRNFQEMTPDPYEVLRYEWDDLDEGIWRRSAGFDSTGPVHVVLSLVERKDNTYEMRLKLGRLSESDKDYVEYGHKRRPALLREKAIKDFVGLRGKIEVKGLPALVFPNGWYRL